MPWPRTAAMLQPPSRPRAPSAATLRVLYQLAYISSGAAVGIGALCAEERRRRTQIVQRIADNAKRIRQSPRYAHGVATAALREQEIEDYACDVEIEQKTAPRKDPREREKRRWSRAALIRESEGAKMPELPSIVEEEYEELDGRAAKKKKKERRKRGILGRPDFVQEHRSREPVSRAEGYTLQPDLHSDNISLGRAIEPRKLTNERIQLDRNTTTGPHVSASSDKLDREEELAGAEHSSPLRPMEYTAPDHFRSGSFATRPQALEKSLPQDDGRQLMTLVYRRASRRDSMGLRGPRMLEGKTPIRSNSKIPFDSIAREFSTHGHWDQDHDSVTPPSWESLREDMDRFFGKVNSNGPDVLRPGHALQLATCLLRLSMELGDMYFVRSLLLWKISVGRFKIEDIEDVIGNFGKIAEAMPPRKALQFAKDLFATSAYCESSAWHKFRLDIKLRAAALRVEEDCTISGSDTVFRDFMDSLTVDKKSLGVCLNRIPDLLEQECTQLMIAGRLQSAVRLWCMTMEALDPKQTDKFFNLDHALFEAAIKARSISLSSRMLRLKASHLLKTNSHQLEAFIRLCSEEGATSLLRKLYVPRENGGLGIKANAGFSGLSYMYLCQAFAEDRSATAYTMFKVFYRRLPAELRRNVADPIVAAQARALTAEWQATRDWDRSRTQYDNAVQRLSEAGINDRALRPLHTAMISIDISAQETVSALERLTTLNNSDFDGIITVLTALALAKRRDWAALERTLSFLQASKQEMRWSVESTQAFNNLLHVYSRHGSAQQLSDLAAMATSELNFRPNRSTREIMLSAFVSKRAFPLLQHWLQLPSTEGSGLKLDSDAGVTMLESWYKKFRHNHAHVMWMCWELAQKAPSLHSQRLLDFVRLRIGYDLKKNHGQNARQMEPIIRSRLALVERSNGAIPRPGYIDNWVLYDDEPASGDEPADGKRTCLDIRSPDLLDGNALSHQESTGVGEGAEADDDTAFWSSFNNAVPMEEAEVQEDPSEGTTEDKKLPSQDQSELFEPDELEYSRLRGSYSDDLSAVHLVENDAVDTENQRDLQLQMRIRLLEGKYESVLDLYHRSRDSNGIPLSALVLELGVEACLRRDDDIGGAMQLLESARAAGMDSTCATGPLLIHKMRKLSQSHFNRQSAKELRAMVMEYYRSNEYKGLNVRHDVGTQAAHVLNNAGFAEHGVNLMNTIYSSHWCAEHPFDTTAMSIWLLGFASLHHAVGMRWVVAQVLEKNMQIDMGFIRALSRAKHPPHRRADGSVYYGRQTNAVHRILLKLSRECHAKRAHQMRRSRNFGKGMLRLMIREAAKQHEPATEDPFSEGVAVSEERHSYEPLPNALVT